MPITHKTKICNAVARNQEQAITLTRYKDWTIRFMHNTAKYIVYQGETPKVYYSNYPDALFALNVMVKG